MGGAMRRGGAGAGAVLRRATLPPPCYAPGATAPAASRSSPPLAPSPSRVQVSAGSIVE